MPNRYRRSTIRRARRKGIVYLLHFKKPYKHARHYIGSTDDLEDRMGRHRSGNGSALTMAAHAAGIEMSLARVWEDVDLSWEFVLKTWGGAGQFCPV